MPVVAPAYSEQRPLITAQTNVPCNWLARFAHFGEQALLGEGKRQASVIALGDVKLLEINKPMFDKINVHVAHLLSSEHHKRVDIEEKKMLALQRLFYGQEESSSESLLAKGTRRKVNGSHTHDIPTGFAVFYTCHTAARWTDKRSPWVVDVGRGICLAVPSTWPRLCRSATGPRTDRNSDGDSRSGNTSNRSYRGARRSHTG